MHTSVIPAAVAKAAAARYLSCLRPLDIAVLQGPPLLGAAVALRQPSVEQAGPLAILIAANVCLVAHIFVLNDWSNLTADLRDPNKAAAVFTSRGVRHTEVGALAMGLLVASLVLFGVLGRAPLSLAIGIAVLSALYSLPQFDWKARPLLNSLDHLAGGALHFLLGYSLGNGLDRRGLIVAVFFAVTFAAGHLAQEIRDYDGDVQSGTTTNAVAFGKRRTFAASVALFTLSHALLLTLALQDILPRALAGLVILYPLQLVWSRRALRDGLTYPSVCRLQARYRAIYAVVGAAVVAALWVG
jgi:4-hydroxybenzoate polyprenyltransferase